MTSRTSSPPTVATGDAVSRTPAAISPPTESAFSTRLFLTVIVIAVLNSVLTGSMVNVLLSEIRDSFDVSTARLSWVITAYSLMYAIGIPLFGRISDFLGTRRLFTAGILSFAIGGLITAIAPSFPLLIIGRMIQGAGGAAIPALGMVMIARAMPENSRGGAMGMIGSAVGIGQAIGPFLGGFIGGSIGWRFLFLIPMVASVVIAVVAQRALPNLQVTGERRFDVIGGGLLAVAIGLFLFGITQGQSSGYGSFVVLSSFLGAMTAAAIFVWRINTAPYPFVPPALFRNGVYVRMLATGIFVMMTAMSTLVLVPLMLVEHNGITPTGAGVALTPGAIALAFGSRYAGRISDRIGSQVPILAGISTMLVAAVILSSVAAGRDAWVVAIGVLILMTGNSMVNAPLNSAASRLLRPEETGIGMGLVSGGVFLGGGMGAAITGAWLNARQNADASAINPLYIGDAAAWSDGFLGIAVMSAIALVLAASTRFTAPTASSKG